MSCHPSYAGTTTPEYLACPFIIRNTYGSSWPDVALIYCPSRPVDAPAMPLQDDPQAVGTPVQSVWYHEIYSLPGTPDPGNQYWDHYGVHNDSARALNYHYSFDGHVYFPLVSQYDDYDNAFVTRPENAVWGLTPTTIQGCHGTSGSGVVTGGSSLYLGSVATGTTPLGTQLCDDMHVSSINRPALTYANHFIWTHIVQWLVDTGRW